jgi:hypothetical protein
MPSETSAWPLNRVLKTLRDHRVRFLLLGGQAAVVYGASQFTRDADFWIEPNADNIRRLRGAMKALGARPRFLPPLELKWLAKGHGVHFSFLHAGRKYLLDFLGKPPRVSGFAQAWRDATRIRWHGLEIRVLDIPRLVRTKKTNRDKDYPAIQALVDSVFEEAFKMKRPSPRVLSFLVEESRSASQLKKILDRWAVARKIAMKSRRIAVQLALQKAPGPAVNQAIRRRKSG